MRQWRVVVASAIAAVLAGFCAMSPADARGVTSTTAGIQDLPRREMNDEVFTNAKGWLIFKGNVDPGWNNRNVQIYKRTCKGCAWKLVKKVTTDGVGRWRTRIYAPRTDYWYWKGIVPKANGYGKSVTQIYRTYVV